MFIFLNFLKVFLSIKFNCVSSQLAIIYSNLIKRSKRSFT